MTASTTAMSRSMPGSSSTRAMPAPGTASSPTMSSKRSGLAGGPAGMSNADVARSSGPPRVAVVGCGYWGANIVRGFSQLHALGAIVEQDAARAERLSADYEVSRREFADVLTDGAID